MKKIVKWLFYILLFVLFFAIFMPKRYLYYAFEHEIKKHDVIISDERIEEGALSLLLQEGTIYIKGAEAAKFEKTAIYPDILVNLVQIEKMRFQLLPEVEIEKILVVYTPLYPVKAFIKGQSSFGPVEGAIDLKSRRGFIDILSTRPIPFMKSIEKGRYRYEFGY
ncbi:MAG: hypothetical protein GXO16_01455 [Epsilonproteobacteria bacterium]|nr:hypothetical protein [Campylobacterota bacterium]